MKIRSPMPRGNGACVVHASLQSGIPGYQVTEFDPRLTLFPPLLRLVPRPRADLVHTVPDYAACLADAATPLVVSFQNYVLDPAMRPNSGFLRHLHNTTLLRQLTRAALRRAAVVTAASRFTADLARADLDWAGEIRVIYNGVDTRAFHPAARPDSGRVRVLYCGNLTARKGAHLFPRILDALDPHIDFIYASGLRTTDRTIPHPRAENAGSVPHRDMPALYNTADILLFPTFREGLSLTVGEAMASGLPVVASNCSSLPEQVVDGEGGFLCPFGDAAAFAARVNLLAGDAVLRRRMGEYNRARAESLFGLESMVAQYRAVFEQVLRPRA